MTTTTLPMTKAGFSAFYSRLSKDTSLMRTLADMQSGVSERKAYEVADAIIRDVAAVESTLEALQEDSAAVIDAFLANAPMLQGDSRMEQLHRIHFGLMLHANPELVQATKEGASAADLFTAYLNTATATEAELTAQVRQQLGSLAVSPQVMDAIVKKMESSTTLLATTASISADSQRFQCILAMQLYEDNKATGMTTAEAAAMASATTQTQQIADAAGRGLITQDKAAKLIRNLSTALSIFGLLCCFPAFTNFISPVFAGATSAQAVSRILLANSGDMIIIGYLMDLVSNACGRLAGKLSARYHFAHADQHAEMMAGLHRMADNARAKASDLKDKAASALGIRHQTDAESIVSEDVVMDADTQMAF